MMLVLVIGMIAFIAWLVRRLGLLNRIAPGSSIGSGKRRLSVIESCTVDGKRRLVLVRRDRTEHLILLTGAGSGVVIERGVEDASDAEGRSKPRAKKAKKSNPAPSQEAEEWEDEDAAVEDDSVTRLVALTKSAWR
ncbi:MAG: hypothetical protein HOM52_05120 [Rhodospirillaceae bacterium]|jgi:flagellar protein FliO/FliZ|nr:hypothetical protein [Rhodospirillaceae bacterium]MBT3626635.1 hypothetical protein [Rhodospirillaceae bacterium]MBT3928359.1 hypothetical protein [Rhodospirillaceae bacterium]MBT5037874.1 hypothetical protein [Rhodospirillaceae bacterium]MBT5780998.1 hypothetical protein [Rhodospirillaceae bacterium]